MCCEKRFAASKMFVWRPSPSTLQTNETQYTETGSNSDQKAIDVCRTRNQL